MQRLALALLGASALTFGSAANAAVTVDAGTTVAVTGPTTVGNTTTIGFSTASLAAPTFSEYVVFTNTLSGLYAITVGTSSSAVDFTSIILSGLSGSYSLVKNFDDGTQEQWGLSGLTLNPDQYTLNIMGNNSAAGSLGGSITISAVPEPGTWAFMLLGFGAMGFAMRRSRKQVLAQLA